MALFYFSIPHSYATTPFFLALFSSVSKALRHSSTHSFTYSLTHSVLPTPLHPYYTASFLSAHPVTLTYSSQPLLYYFVLSYLALINFFQKLNATLSLTHSILQPLTLNNNAENSKAKSVQEWLQRHASQWAWRLLLHLSPELMSLAEKTLSGNEMTTDHEGHRPPL